MRLNASVSRVIVEGDRAVGVTLDNGENVRAGLVISAINPRTTFQKLLGPRHLDAGFYKRTHHIRSRGAAAKLHLALNGTPYFRRADLKSRLVIAPSVRAVEDSFNAVKYGEVPPHPVLEAILPSAYEAGFAPRGCHTLSAIVQFAPHEPKTGRDAARAQMLENTLAVLETHAPGLRKMISNAKLLMPYDIESRYGMIGGNWHHGELAVEQMLFLRPLPEAAQYATPLSGLWLAGAGWGRQSSGRWDHRGGRLERGRTHFEGGQMTELAPFKTPRKQTPLHARTAAANRLNHWGVWAGYTTALCYGDEAMEHMAIRNGASVYDFSPMVKYRITGPEAADYLNRLTVRDAAKLAVGSVQYTVWCDDAGKVLDDGTLFRHGAEEYLLCCHERHLPWLLDSAIGYDVTVREVTEEIAAPSL